MATTQSAPDAYSQLLAQCREISLLSGTSALLAWDQETLMPKGAGERRAEQLALLASLVHERATAPRLAELLAKSRDDVARDGDPDGERAAVLRELQRDFDRATRLPASLVTELARTESQAQQAWAEARQRSDFAGFRPWLERMVALQQQKADCLAIAGATRWDALADLYEPGMRAADLRRLFGPLRTRLVALRERLADGERPDDTFQRTRIDAERQRGFVREVVAAMGFDFDRGRLDTSAHPFCTSIAGDVRLTTRFHDDNVLDALGSTMHEGGHGLYEQGLPREPFGSPLGEAVSLGIHESQSRLWENHVGRSAAFWQWCWPVAQRHLGAACDGQSAQSVHALSNLVAPSLIRVEADEATYDLHVMVRFELEQGLIGGDLPVAELPQRWNALYRDHLGVEVPDDRRGCLQDVHWSCGLFGYFPTYTLGNLYAAQFAAAADQALGGLAPLLAKGEFAPLREWLRENVHRHGRRYLPAELCQRATGAALSSEPFLAYLERKLFDVYGVA
ncbi:MAG: carboxypeptidase M32 [Planctomycetes bacterium]|nr:carboxypeptidase M32 [Planctomycetota bacterium]